MASAHKIKDDMNALQRDVSKVIDDLGKLTSHLGSAGIAAVEAGSSQVAGSIESEIEVLRDKVAGINATIQEYGKMAKQSVRAHPFAYTAGALGLGVLLGKLLLGSYRSSD